MTTPAPIPSPTKAEREGVDALQARELERLRANGYKYAADERRERDYEHRHST